MKKIFTLCMAAAFAFALPACSDDDDNGNNGGQQGTITLGNQTEKVKSAFCATIPTQNGEEGGSYILLFKDDFKVMPGEDAQPDFYIQLFVPESGFGKQIDLTKVFPKNGTLSSFLIIGNKTHEIEIGNTNIDVDPAGLTVSSGSLKATRDGDKFAVKFSLTLSNGHVIAADWSGSAKSVAAPIDSGTMTLGTVTEQVGSAFTSTTPSQEGQESGAYLALFKENFTEFPEDEPDFFVGVLVSDSSFDKQIDLTKALTKSGTHTPFLQIGTPTHNIEIDETGVCTLPEGLTVTSGSLKVTRNDDKFSVKFTATFSDGHTIATDWSGTPREGAELGS